MRAVRSLPGRPLSRRERSPDRSARPRWLPPRGSCPSAHTGAEGVASARPPHCHPERRRRIQSPAQGAPKRVGSDPLIAPLLSWVWPRRRGDPCGRPSRRSMRKGNGSAKSYASQIRQTRCLALIYGCRAGTSRRPYGDIRGRRQSCPARGEGFTDASSSHFSCGAGDLMVDWTQ